MYSRCSWLGERVVVTVCCVVCVIEYGWYVGCFFCNLFPGIFLESRLFWDYILCQ